MIKEELDKITLDSVRTVLEEIGFDVRSMDQPMIVVENDHVLMAQVRSFKPAPNAKETLKNIKKSMKQQYWDLGVGRVYLYKVHHHIISCPDNFIREDYRPVIRYALHLDVGTREGFELE